MVKIDLHNHVAISFHPAWLKLQGYSRKNILELLIEKCLVQDIGICAVTSQEWQIPKNSHHDRLNYLFEHYAPKLNQNIYYCHRIGENALVAGKPGLFSVHFINGQTVNVIEKDGDGNEQRLDHLVVGSNQVPNRMNVTSSGA